MCETGQGLQKTLENKKAHSIATPPKKKQKEEELQEIANLVLEVSQYS